MKYDSLTFRLWSPLFLAMLLGGLSCEKHQESNISNEKKWLAFSEIINGTRDLQNIDYCDLKYNDLTPSFLEYSANSFDYLPFKVEKTSRVLTFKLGLSIANETIDQVSCNELFEDGLELFKNSFDQFLHKNTSEWTFEKSQDSNVKTVQETITGLAANDHAARTTWLKIRAIGNKRSPTEEWALALAEQKIRLVDQKSSQYMEQLLIDITWVDIKTYGEDTSFFAWMLIQHADINPGLQAEALSRMGPYLENGEVSKSDYALLVDRVAVNTDKPQMYGTQSTGRCIDGLPEMQPIENIGALDDKRKKMDLEPHQIYLKSLARTVCPH